MVTKKSAAVAKKVPAKSTRPVAKVAPAAVVASPAPVVDPAVNAQAPVEKQKLVRDSFTIPKREYEVLAALKGRLVKLARPTKKSELLRAGIASLAGLSDAKLLEAVEAVPALKTGRPTASMGKGKKSEARKA